MSDSGGSPSSSPPPPPPLDSSSPPPPNSSEKSSPPPPDSSSSTIPPSDSSPPPSEPSPPPPPESKLPPLPSIFPPFFRIPRPPPPAVDPPPTDAKTSPPPPPTSTESPSPPSDSETPPSPPNEPNNPPPSQDVQSPPPPSSSTNPEKPADSPPPPQPINSPPSPPTEPTNSPPSPPSDPTNSPPILPSGPDNPPPLHPDTPPSPFLPPPRRAGAPGEPVASPSLTVPNNETTPPTSSSNGNSYQGKAMVGLAVTGFALIALIAVVFLVRRKKKKKNIDSYGHSQYLPHPPPNFSVKSDGFLYGQDPGGKGYSGGPNGSSMYNNSQQHSAMGNSYGAHHQRQLSGTPDSAILGSGQTHFSYEELAEITQGFARQNILGEGGFGCVYKGTLHDGRVVAVKQLKAGSGQGDREFKAEVEIISRVHHCHLVSLVGYCISDQHRLLIYEYVSNQTLEHHLHGKGMPVLEWSKRLRIAIGSAKGLAYLHEDCHPKIIHRDIKSANILLDDEYEAQVADFGLARLNDTTQTHVSTRVMGTFGYLAPEYASSGKLTDRSDVFSFGVVLLELVTGRKPVDQSQPLGEESLVEWARPLLLQAIETGDYSELIDKRLEKHYVEHEVIRMIETAAACVRHSGPKRPRMVQVVRALDCDGDSGDISNGIKVGQSTTYDSGQYNQDIMKFRKMAFGLDDSIESGMYSGDYSVKSSSDFSANESETRPFNNRRF